MATVKEHSYLYTHLLSLQELSVMGQNWNPKKRFYQIELQKRQNITYDNLCGGVFKLLQRENTKATKQEKLTFSRKKVSKITLRLLFEQKFGTYSIN